MSRREFFQSSQLTYIASNALNHSWVQSKGNRITPLNTNSLDILYETYRRSKSIPSIVSGSTASTVKWIGDPYDMQLQLSMPKAATFAPEGYFVCLVDPIVALNMECAFDFQSKKIGYVDRSDYVLTKAIARGYRIPDTAYQLSQVPADKVDQLDTLLQSKQYDIIVTYIIPQSAYHMMIKKQKVTIKTFNKLDITRVFVSYPFVELKKVDVKWTFISGTDSSTQLMVMADDANGPLLSMSMPIYDVKNSITTVEGFITRLEQDPTSFDPSYRCYGDPNIRQKALCDSKFDPQQFPKEHETIWDQPCIKDEDCPYYKANQNYPNTRGGCMKGGICEMPVGIKRVAYRKVEKNAPYQPFCYGCKDPKDPDCCSRQQKPDYAFPNDIEERIAAGKQTIIPID